MGSEPTLKVILLATKNTDGTLAPVLVDGDGNFVVRDMPDAAAASAASGADTTALAASLVVKASAGNLYGVIGYNSKTSAQFVQVHDAASLPADAAVPELVIRVEASSNFFIDLGKFPKPFSVGIVICNSSTAATKTIGSADCWFSALYK